eukprot:9068511-Pyramimonas_sp.AAC.1
MHDGRPRHSKRGAFSTPCGVRKGWSLTGSNLSSMEGRSLGRGRSFKQYGVGWHTGGHLR